MDEKPIYICITPFFPSKENWRGGYVLDQVKAIERNSDFRVVVFKTEQFPVKDQNYEIAGIRVYRFQEKSTPSYLFNGFFNERNQRSFLKAFEEVMTELYGENYSSVIKSKICFVHAHTGPYAIYALAIKSVYPCAKTIVQHHDLDPYTIRNGILAKWKVNARYRAINSIQLFKDLDLHICVSNPCKDNLLAFPDCRKNETYEEYKKALEPLHGMEHVVPKAVYVLNNGVDTLLFKPTTSKHEHYRIGCVANFNQLKGHITLIKAFERLVNAGYKNLILSLLGTGEERKSCERYIREKNLSEYVEWPAEVNHEQLPDYYSSLDLFVLPSYFEGFGCVYTEAYACGVPFMGCYDNGAAECIREDERANWLVAAHDDEQLSKIIEQQYMNPQEQHLCSPINIDILITSYLEYLKTI